MNILITGGSGFIGLMLADRFLRKGHRVRVLVRDVVKAQYLLDDRCEICKGDITNKDSLNGCCDGIDVVYQMIAKVGNDLPSAETLEKFRDVNVKGLDNICQEAIKAGVKRFISISSIAAMGIVRHGIINEESPCNPYLPYQVSKREGELLVLKLIEEQNFPAIIVRPAKVYGYGEREYSYLKVAQLCKKGFFPKVGWGKNLASHCYITDLIDGLECCLEKGNIGSTYIFASEGSIGFNESARLIARLMDKKIVFIPIPKWLMIMTASIIEKIFTYIGKTPPLTARNVEATTTNRVYDLTKIRTELRFIPKVTMEEGITKVMQYYKDLKLI